jgi:succinoglycan biosynthesis transport protein ExoP
MQYLPAGPNDDFKNGINGENYLLPDLPRRAYPLNNNPAEEDQGESLHLGRLLRKYWLLLLAMVIVGVAGGVISVVLSSPMYQSRLLVELQNPNGGLMRSDNGGGAEASELDIQTEVTILRSAIFRKRGADRMQADSVPLAPTGHDIFSKLRQRIHPATESPMDAFRTGLAVAVTTFNAQPVIRTRLIELSCESTSPDVAAQFLNSIAEEFKDDSVRSRQTTAQKTGEWVASQIEQTKAKVAEAEERLRDFGASSGNLFAGQDASTLDDTKLAQLKLELSKIQSERINRQTRYELTVKYPPEQLAEVLDDSVLRGYQQQIETLKRERAVLLTTFTEKHEKVRKVDVQLAQLEKAYETEVTSVIKRIRHDYEASQQEERLLSREFAGESQRVGSLAGKAATYNSLKREVETQRQMYQTLLMQENQASLSGSVPILPIRVVEAATFSQEPYKPRPVLNVSFGVLFGLALTGGLIFLRERMDRSIRLPGVSRRLFNTPELGVIPNLGSNGNAIAKRGWLASKKVNGNHDGEAAALMVRQDSPQFVTESFRSTLASILRNQAGGRPQKIILVTSPGPSEGKTTVVQNLGIVLAETGRRVLLVDADFRRPHLHRKFGMPNEWGLIDLLCEDLPLNEYPPERMETPTGIPGLSIFPNRVTQHNVARALYSPRLRATLEILSSRYDMILVDAPPILGVADARIIAPLADSVILVMRCGVTDRENAMEAYQRIQDDCVPLLGTVLTDYDLSADRRRQYYYDYGDTSRV